MSALDTTYGTATPPTNASEYERQKFPDSLLRLNERTAAMLAELLNSAKNGFHISRVAHGALSILWLMDSDGIVWLSLEERYSRSGIPNTLPNIPKVAFSEDYKKLGHPSLVAAANARIAGELTLANNGGAPIWYVSNKSGRYGIRPDIQSHHISNIAALFANYGVNVNPHFIPWQG